MFGEVLRGWTPSLSRLLCLPLPRQHLNSPVVTHSYTVAIRLHTTIYFVVWIAGTVEGTRLSASHTKLVQLETTFSYNAEYCAAIPICVSNGERLYWFYYSISLLFFLSLLRHRLFIKWLFFGLQELTSSTGRRQIKTVDMSSFPSFVPACYSPQVQR